MAEPMERTHFKSPEYPAGFAMRGDYPVALVAINGEVHAQGEMALAVNKSQAAAAGDAKMTAFYGDLQLALAKAVAGNPQVAMPPIDGEKLEQINAKLTADAKPAENTPAPEQRQEQRPILMPTLQV